MTDRDSCNHHFEHVKQTRPFTEREYMQCTKCGYQNPLGLFQHWDTERDGPAFKWPPRATGGNLPTGLTEITNTTGRPERVYTREEIQQTWDNLKMAMVPFIKNLVKVWDELRHNRKLMETIAQHQAIDNGHRYWHDHQGQPRRNPTMRPLLHNGKKPR